MKYEDGGYSPPEDDSPEAKLLRHDARQEEIRTQAVDRLLFSLTPADAHMPLFTFDEVRTWNLKRRRKSTPSS